MYLDEASRKVAILFLPSEAKRERSEIRHGDEGDVILRKRVDATDVDFESVYLTRRAEVVQDRRQLRVGTDHKLDTERPIRVGRQGTDQAALPRVVEPREIEPEVGAPSEESSDDSTDLFRRGYRRGVVAVAFHRVVTGTVESGREEIAEKVQVDARDVRQGGQHSDVLAPITDRARADLRAGNVPEQGPASGRVVEAETGGRNLLERDDLHMIRDVSKAYVVGMSTC